MVDFQISVGAEEKALQDDLLGFSIRWVYGEIFDLLLKKKLYESIIRINYTNQLYESIIRINYTNTKI
jgi:hypothetical protein